MRTTLLCFGLALGVAIGCVIYKVSLDIWSADYEFVKQHVR